MPVVLRGAMHVKRTFIRLRDCFSAGLFPVYALRRGRRDCHRRAAGPFRFHRNHPAAAAGLSDAQRYRPGHALRRILWLDVWRVGLGRPAQHAWNAFRSSHSIGWVPARKEGVWRQSHRHCRDRVVRRRYHQHTLSYPDRPAAEQNRTAVPCGRLFLADGLWPDNGRGIVGQEYL